MQRDSNENEHAQQRHEYFAGLPLAILGLFLYPNSINWSVQIKFNTTAGLTNESGSGGQRRKRCCASRTVAAG